MFCCRANKAVGYRPLLWIREGKKTKNEKLMNPAVKYRQTAARGRPGAATPWRMLLHTHTHTHAGPDAARPDRKPPLSTTRPRPDPHLHLLFVTTAMAAIASSRSFLLALHRRCSGYRSRGAAMTRWGGWGAGGSAGGWGGVRLGDLTGSAWSAVRGRWPGQPDAQSGGTPPSTTTTITPRVIRAV